MKGYQNSLLAGIAALALIAGTGMASAQVQPDGQSGTPPSGQQHATPNGGGRTGMHAQGENRDSQGKSQSGTNRTAQNANQGMQPNGKGEGPQSRDHGKSGATAQNGNSAAQPNAQSNNPANRSSGRNQNQNQANNGGQQRVQTASGTNVHFSTQQRTRIRQTIIDAHNAPRADHVGFSVNVGTVITRPEISRIHVIPVPEYLVRIEPRWRGLEYFVFRDEVVIVNPRDLRIVAIVPV